MATFTYYHCRTWFFALCEETNEAYYVQLGGIRQHTHWNKTLYKYANVVQMMLRAPYNGQYKQVTKCQVRRLMKQIGLIEQPFPVPKAR